MANELENKKTELLNLNRLWSDAQELGMKNSTLKKVKNRILRKISLCEKAIIKMRNKRY